MSQVTTYAFTFSFNGMGMPQFLWAIRTKEIVFSSGLYILIEPGEYYYGVRFDDFTGGAFNTTTGSRTYAIEDNSQINPEDEIQILNLESRWDSGIPAGLEQAEKWFELPPECPTGLLSAGVITIATAAHMHKRGTEMLMHWTCSDLTNLVFNLRPYLHVWKPRTVQDLVKCFWDTTGEANPVPGGIKADQEMCSVFLAADKGSPFPYVGSRLT